jgi:hypothetical protein
MSQDQTVTEHDVLDVIDERDRAEEWADKLAAAIAPPEVLGEHTSGNNPWANALEHANRKTPAASESAGDQTARIAASIDWIPTCLPGQERQTIVRQVLDAAASPAASEQAAVKGYEVRGDWLCARVDACTCVAPESPHGGTAHRDGCGLEPVVQLSEVGLVHRPAASGDERDWTCHCHSRCVGASCPCICHKQDRQIATIKAHLQRRTETLRNRAERAEARIEKALAVCDAGKHQATRWEQPFPVPAWVTDVRAALTSTEEQK